MANHVVRHTYGIDDEIRIVEHQFDSYHEAFLHAETSNAHTVRLYSPSGELLSERQESPVSSADTSTPTES
jgi:hypothetical protein